MNWEDFGRNCSWPDLHAIPTLVWRNPGKLGEIKLIQNSQCHRREPDQAPPEYKSRAFLVDRI
jgi:hypothetical protein